MEVGYEKPYLAWMLMPVGGIISFIKGMREEKSQKVKTHLDEFMKHVLVAFLVSLFIVLGFMSKLGLSTYPLVMMVYGFWLYISGGAINLVLTIAAFFVGFELQLLFLGMAVLLGYIIPGYILRNRYNKAAKLSPNNAKESYV